MYGFHSTLKLGIFEKYILDFDIICLSETRLSDSTECYIDGFKSFTHHKGGIHGISVLVKK